MARVKVTADNLSAELDRILEKYKDDLDKNVDQIAKTEAAQGAAALRNSSPKRTGDYAADWTYKKGDKYSQDGAHDYVIYNKGHYQLTHLLEHGHATRQGGRTPPKEGKKSFVAARTHITPVEEVIKRDFPERIKLVAK